MQIKQQEYNHKGSFFVEENGKLQAELTYTLSDPDILIIVHTEVSISLKGKNVGYQLLEQAAEFARKKNYKIIPHCTFAQSVFKKKRAAFEDVLKESLGA